MLPEAHTTAHPETAVRQPGAQKQPPSDPLSSAPPAPPPRTSDAREAREAQREEPLPTAPEPIPPRGRLAVSIQQMAPAARWALGLSLAFVSGVAILFAPFVNAFSLPPIMTATALIVMGVIALAAGIVLSRWRALPALAVAAAAGGWVASGVNIQMSPPEAGGGVKAVFDLFAQFAMFELVALIAFLLAGIGIGKWRGMARWKAHALSADAAKVGRWVAAVSLVIAGGFLAARPIGVAFMGEPEEEAWSIISRMLVGILFASVLAGTCLLASWLLRSWWGLALGTVVYVGVAALTSQLFGGVYNWSTWVVGFVIYIVLPAVGMSAIGTIIGMYSAERGGRQHPQVAGSAT